MTFLPIVARELAVAARRPATYWLRFGMVFLLLALSLLIIKFSGKTASTGLGQHLLRALAAAAFAFALFAGVFRTADCLSGEKREGTLGLLFLTDLRPCDVILGKLAAAAIPLFFCLFAMVPVLSLGLLVGGVTLRECARLALVLPATLFFSLGMGILVSAVSLDVRQAFLRAFFLLFSLTALLPALWFLQSLLLGHPAPDWLLLPSPGYAVVRAFNIPYHLPGGAAGYWWSLATVFFIGLLAIASAGWLLPHFWVQEAASASRFKRKRRWRPKWFRGTRKLGPGMNPMFWLSTRDTTTHDFIRTAFFCSVPVWFTALVLVFAFQGNPIPFFALTLAAYFLHQVVKLLVAVEASRRMNEDRQSGALELLLVTPLPVKSILLGQRKALWLQCRWIIVPLVLINIGLCVLLDANPMGLNQDLQVLFGEMFVGGACLLAFDFYALGWAGLWDGVQARRHLRAVGGTLARIMGAPWVGILLIFFLQPLANPQMGALMLVIWFAISAGIDANTGLNARRRLLIRFRRIASQRFEAR